MSRPAARPARRNNAPVRPPRAGKGSTFPDLLFCLATGMWTMAVILLAATFTNESILAGNAGAVIGRLFAASLVAAGIFVFLVGMLLLRDSRGQRDHYVTPILLGVIMGAIEAVLFLEPAELWLAAPLLILILILALRPVRRALARMAGQSRDWR